MNSDLINLANVIAGDLREEMTPNIKLYRTGNMRRSVMVVVVDEKTVDIVIATDYASFTNERGKWQGWVRPVVSRATKAYCEARNVEDFSNLGIIEPTIL